MFARLLPVAAPRVDGGEAVVARRAELAVPCRLEVARIGAVELALKVARKAEVIERFAGVRIRLTARLALDGADEVRFRLGEKTTRNEPLAVERMRTAVLGIAP